MITLSSNKDLFNDYINFYKEEQTQSHINRLKKNLTEANIYTQIFNIYKFEKIMEQKEVEKENQKNKKKENNEKKNLLDIEETEQIDEVKINMLMIFSNECDYSENDKEHFSYIIGNYIKVKRLIIEDCQISSQKLLLNKKDYIFIPMTEDFAFP